MAELLKNHFGPDVPKKIAGMITTVHPAFPAKSFLADVLNGYEALELMPRGRHIAKALHRHLPSDYKKAIGILLASIGPKLERTENFGMSVFLYMPYLFYVAEHGLDHLEHSLKAQYELTQRFTAEFSIRPYLERHPEAVLDRLKTWARDKSAHVRRLVSEGTRPRLPWASRLRAFQKDPRPVLELLELLKDDPALYVRRSVANNLNDIGKDHPALLIETAARWMKGASAERRRLIEHALRSMIKQGNPAALKVLGFSAKTRAAITAASIKKGPDNNMVTIAFTVKNTGAMASRFLIDFQIHYVKSNGRSAPKVFKLKEAKLKSNESVHCAKNVSLRTMTTRKHYPGRHRVDALINGRAFPLGHFTI